MEYNLNERIAIARVLLEMMNADGKIHAYEASYFQSIKAKIKLTDIEFLAAKNMNTLLALALIRNLSQEKKIALVLMLQLMMKADGEIDTKEQELFGLIITVCDLGSAFNL